MKAKTRSYLLSTSDRCFLILSFRLHEAHILDFASCTCDQVYNIQGITIDIMSDNKHAATKTDLELL